MKRRPRRVWAGCQPVAPSIKPIDPVVDDTNWRERIQKLNNVKFDDNAKLRFLQELEESGKIGLACQAAGISTSAWRKHAQREPDFYDAVKHTIEVFNSNRAAKLERQAMNGFKEVIFGPNGERGERTRYETQLRVMILKAADKEMYRDESNVNVNVTGGAFIVPAMLSPDEWEKQFAEQQAGFIPDSQFGTAPVLTEGETVDTPVKRPLSSE